MGKENPTVAQHTTNIIPQAASIIENIFAAISKVTIDKGNKFQKTAI